ncbi:MAG TPA: Rieske 2Fe-2S domain-containing protein [Anaerolineales bacterium]|nr:Rieske 2Fe-2S domain-containing protein [Anaerolineales bacterium]
MIRTYQPLFSPEPDAQGYYPICRVAQLAETVLTVKLTGWQLLLLLQEETGQMQVRAYSALCPHQSANLAIGELVSYDGKLCIECPLHQWRFDLRDGKQQYPAENHLQLTRYLTEVRADGKVWVQLGKG